MQQICAQKYPGSTEYATDICTGNAKIIEYGTDLYTGICKEFMYSTDIYTEIYKEYRVCNRYVRVHIKEYVESIVYAIYMYYIYREGQSIVDCFLQTHSRTLGGNMDRTSTNRMSTEHLDPN
jgi:hypothetical protein